MEVIMEIHQSFLPFFQSKEDESSKMISIRNLILELWEETLHMFINVFLVNKRAIKGLPGLRSSIILIPTWVDSQTRV